MVRTVNAGRLTASGAGSAATTVPDHTHAAVMADKNSAPVWMFIELEIILCIFDESLLNPNCSLEIMLIVGASLLANFKNFFASKLAPTTGLLPNGLTGLKPDVQPTR
jgi:hypothetical protein